MKIENFKFALKKSIYGLKQSGRNWLRTLKVIAFENSVFDEYFIRGM